MPLAPLPLSLATDCRAWALSAAALGAAAVGAALAGQVAAATALGTAAAIATLHATGALRERDVLHPAVLIAGMILVLTVGRVLYVLDRDGFGLRLTEQLPLDGNEQAFALGVIAQLAGAALLAIGVARGSARGATATRPSRDVDVLPLSLAIAAVAVASGVSIGLLIHEAGGIGEYVDALGYRQVFFDDRGFALVFPTMLPGLVLAWLAVNIGSLHTGNRRAVALALVVVAGLAAASTGTRSQLVFFLLVPAVALFRMRVRRIPIAAAIVIAALVFAGASLYREQIRDRGSPSTQAVYQDGAKGFVVNTFASPDAHQPDPVAMLIIHDADPKLGTTIAAAVLAPVPRRIWGGKPTGAGPPFTELESRGGFVRNKTEFAITLAGELYWNFWWPGLVVFALVGLAAGTAYRTARIRPDDPTSALRYAAVLGTALLLVRTDVYNTTVVAAQVFVPALALLWLGGRLAERR